MKPSFRLRQYLGGEAATLYTVVYADREQSELDRFLKNPAVKANPDFRPLLQRLFDGVHEFGFPSDWFRDEEGVWALYAPYPADVDTGPDRFPPQLRLYCIRLPGIIIAGTGGVKTKRTFQEQPELLLAVRELQHVDRRLWHRMEAGDVSIHDRHLTGTDEALSFNAEDPT